MEKVDILLATYNGARFLKEQLDSILNQTYSDFRLIISDDKSTDKTKAIIEEYAKKDSRIEYYIQENNLGVIRNFEFLMRKVENKYFMFSDQDDIWKENKIEKSLEVMEKEDADLVYSDLEVVDRDLNTIYKSYWKLKGLDNKVKKYNDFAALYLNNFITGCTMLCKKNFIDLILPLPTKSKYVLHDYWVALIVSQHGKMAYIKEPLIKYRQHKDNKIGSRKRSDEITNFDELRYLFIDVKIEHFTVFVENENKFTSLDVRSLSKEALIYFENLRRVNIINFSKWKLFFELYKYEDFGYKMQNFLILNIPILARPLMKLKKKMAEKKQKKIEKK